MSTEIPVSNASTEAVKVSGVKINVPSPYAEGHALRANEAHALNAYYHNCVRNGAAPKVKAKLQEIGAMDSNGQWLDSSKADPKAVQAVIDEYVADYDFGQAGSRGTDPVEAEAMEIARQNVRAALQRKGAKVSEYSAKQITQKAKELLQSKKYGDKIRQKAGEIVKSREDLGDIDI